MKRMALIASFVAGSASAQIPGFTSTTINFSGNASSQAVDPSGNIWITDPTNAAIGKIELPSQTYTAYPVPASETNAKPYSIAVTPDGAVWYTDYNNPIIGRLSVDGTFTLYAVASKTFYIAASPDGGVFFSYFTAPGLGYLSLLTGGPPVTFPLPAGAFVESVAVGPDGAAYLTDLHNNRRIVRVGLDGSVKSFPVTAANPPFGFTWFSSITTGPDGNLWFTHATAIGRLRLSDGVITEFPIPYAMADAGGICAGADGNVWYADSLAGAGVVGQLVVSTATDDGHATINASPGIGEPIGILSLPPRADQAQSNSAVQDPSGSESPAAAKVCPGIGFSLEQNSFNPSNLQYVTLPGGSGPCADLRFLPALVTPPFGALGPQPIGLIFNIFNAGPNAANPPVLEVSNVVGAERVAVTGSQWPWTCSSEKPTFVTCVRTSPLAAGSSDQGTIVINPVSVGDSIAPYVEIDAAVFSSTDDPILFNNVFSLGYSIASPRSKVLLIGLPTNNVRIGPGRP